MNKEQFFNSIRKPLFNNVLSKSQVEGLDFFLDYQPSSIIQNLKQFSYILATVHHETDKTFQPIEEYGKGKTKDYGKRLKMNRTPYTDTPNIFYGRGYTQNTWYENYEKLTEENPHGWDFFNNPELLLQKEPSIWATFYSMKTGLYTGRKLSEYDYFNNSVLEENKASSIYKLPKWYNARKIVNGLDKAELIARYSTLYYNALI